jgi:hypothetical protein
MSDLQNLNNNSTFNEISRYFKENYSKLQQKKFHYSSRLYLWTKEEEYLTQLEELEPKFLGHDADKTTDYFRNLLTKDLLPANQSKVREESLKKHFKIRNLNRILFKRLFWDRIYGINTIQQVFDVIALDELISIAKDLNNDPESIAVLSTIAVNYLYLVSDLINVDSRNPKKIIDVQKLFEIAQTYRYSLDVIDLKIYLITHCIIGESRFYSQIIDSNIAIYKEMLLFLEDLIYKKYFHISLDNKLEYLLCTRIMGLGSSLESIIINEAENSISTEGSFIVDTLNKSLDKNKKSFLLSEHRNTLYLMLKNKPFLY